MNLVTQSGETSRFEYYEEEREDLSHLTEEEFVRKYYKKVISFEEVLRRADSNLKLYQIDGSPILTSTDRMEQIAKLKKKCL